ncbi:MAG: hypothetical protein IT260_00020 [Saprospiraceae bacterium]|nr:hypothetical protein [Saprospiraceae bacterium]
MLRPFFKKYNVFGLYWLALLPLAGFLAYDYTTDASHQLDPALSFSLEKSIDATRRSGEDASREAYHFADAYPSKRNKTLWQQTRAAKRLTGRVQQQIQACRDAGWPPPVVHTLAGSLRETADSLLSVAATDSVLADGLRRLLLEPASALPATAHLLRRARPAAAGLYVQDLIWKTELALYLCLSTLCHRAESAPDTEVDNVLPVLELDNCPEAGKPFSGVVFLAEYSSQSDSVTCRVDGQALVLHNGIASIPLFRAKPGLLKKQLRMEYRNPLTHEVKTYIKEFHLPFLQP